MRISNRDGMCNCAACVNGSKSVVFTCLCKCICLRRCISVYPVSATFRGALPYERTRVCIHINRIHVHIQGQWLVCVHVNLPLCLTTCARMYVGATQELPAALKCRSFRNLWLLGACRLSRRLKTSPISLRNIVWKFYSRSQ